MTIPSDIPSDRHAEYSGLIDLLMAHADSHDAEAPALADRIARGCIESGHLWRTMHLGSRDELRALLRAHFGQLAAGNTQDMRWKKYLYKRLCGWPGFEG